MKTTELFVEQVLIGVAVLFVGCLLVLSSALSDLAAAKFGEAALLVGASYVLGMFYDRIADTLLQDLEQSHRLLFAIREYYRRGGMSAEDPFPENRWRARLSFSTKAAVDQATYLRSRIRLTRAIATLLPAVGIGTVLLVARVLEPWRLAFVWSAVAIYMIVFLMKLMRRPAVTSAALEQAQRGPFTLPRTDALTSADVRGWYEAQIGGYDRHAGRPKHPVIRILARADTPVAFGLLLSTVICIASALASSPGGSRPGAMAIAIGTPLITALAGWTWWRITETFFAFLQEHDPYARIALEKTASVNSVARV